MRYIEMTVLHRKNCDGRCALSVVCEQHLSAKFMGQYNLLSYTGDKYPEWKRKQIDSGTWPRDYNVELIRKQAVNNFYRSESFEFLGRSVTINAPHCYSWGFTPKDFVKVLEAATGYKFEHNRRRGTEPIIEALGFNREWPHFKGPDPAWSGEFGYEYYCVREVIKAAGVRPRCLLCKAKYKDWYDNSGQSQKCPRASPRISRIYNGHFGYWREKLIGDVYHYKLRYAEQIKEKNKIIAKEALLRAKHQKERREILLWVKKAKQINREMIKDLREGKTPNLHQSESLVRASKQVKISLTGFQL